MSWLLLLWCFSICITPNLTAALSTRSSSAWTSSSVSSSPWCPYYPKYRYDHRTLLLSTALSEVTSCYIVLHEGIHEKVLVTDTIFCHWALMITSITALASYKFKDCFSNLLNRKRAVHFAKIQIWINNSCSLSLARVSTTKVYRK